ncbi:HD domain-containing protein [Saccharicrinis sp. FJH62]|uniref:HD domain-containing protein n=1 Tax=Saccharicrinis sp. FJH62 TaxID=3344657 RepID=UPI0035D414B3
MHLNSLPYYFEDVLKVDEVKRLSGIRFHGTLSFFKKNNNFSSRLEHSIKVAEFAYHISDKHNFNNDITDAFILSALLHDIGHLPFSHILEPLYRSSSLNYHEGVTSLIIRRLIAKNEQIRKIFNDKVLSICLSLFNHSNEYSVLENLLFGFLSLDTIEGIDRACKPLDKEELTYDPLKIVDNIIIDGNNILISNEAISEVLKFRDVKKNLYNNYISSEKAISLSAMIIKASQISLSDKKLIKDLPKLNDFQIQDMMLENEFSREIIGMIVNKNLFEKLPQNIDELETSNENTLTAYVNEFEYRFNENKIDSLQYCFNSKFSENFFLLSDIVPFLKYSRIFKEEPTIYIPSNTKSSMSFDIEKLKAQDRFTWW